MTEFTTTRLGDRVGYDRYGDGPLVVFVSGAGPYRATDPVTTPTAQRAAAAGLSTVVYDRPGRGESPAEGRIGLDRELAAIESLVDGAGGPAVLCGHSSGCWISLAAAARGLPVSGLVLWEAPMAPPQQTREWAAEFERRLDAGALEPALEQYMKDMPPEWLEGARQSPAFPGMVAQVPSYRADAEAMAWSVSQPLPELLHDVRVPLEVMAGEQTFPQMLASGEALSQAVPGAVATRLPGANHSWEPGPMADALVGFVQAAAVT